LPQEATIAFEDGAAISPADNPITNSTIGLIRNSIIGFENSAGDSNHNNSACEVFGNKNLKQILGSCDGGSWGSSNCEGTDFGELRAWVSQCGLVDGAVRDIQDLTAAVARGGWQVTAGEVHLREELGKGAFGSIHRARYGTELLAVKRIRPVRCQAVFYSLYTSAILFVALLVSDFSYVQVP
jgi:hypothetical protein